MERKKCLVLGSHKGLGLSCVKLLLKQESVSHILGISRLDSGLFTSESRYCFYSSDLTKLYDQEVLFREVLKNIKEFNPDQIIYCAGGGPFGEFSSKAWKDHEWAIKLNFLFPAKLVWSILRDVEFKASLQFLYVGSSIAESNEGDPYGASYASAKWAMKGLLKSLDSSQIKYGSEKVQYLWMSPGYMNTDLLPKGSEPRISGEHIDSPDIIAQKIISMLGY